MDTQQTALRKQAGQTCNHSACAHVAVLMPMHTVPVTLSAYVQGLFHHCVAGKGVGCQTPCTRPADTLPSTAAVGLQGPARGLKQLTLFGVPFPTVEYPPVVSDKVAALSPAVAASPLDNVVGSFYNLLYSALTAVSVRAFSQMWQAAIASACMVTSSSVWHVRRLLFCCYWL